MGLRSSRACAPGPWRSPKPGRRRPVLDPLPGRAWAPRGWAAGWLAVAALAGCSVTAEDDAHRLPDAEVPFDLLAPGRTTVPSSTPQVGTAALYLISDGRLEPVFREVPANPR